MRTGKSIKGAINYNEDKVRKGVAELIMASQFSRDICEVGFSEKLLRFEKLNQLSPKTKTNTLHLSLNFSKDESLDSEKLQQIAADYMERIGFGDQPFLVYLHKDTAHPHLHIVTSTVKPNGKPIFLHNLAKRKSEPARIAIEDEYGLIRAKGRKQYDLNIEEKNETLSKKVLSVISQYRFTSLSELNSILRQYDIKADRGYENSTTYLNNGLVYCRIDDAGCKTGNSIKASAINNACTLKGLNKAFERNRLSKIAFRNPLQLKILNTLYQTWKSDHFINLLKDQHIDCSIRYESDGTISNISFVDHNTKTVFSSEELGLNMDALLAHFNTPAQKIKEIIKIKSKAQKRENSTEIKFQNVIAIDLIKSLLPTNIHQPDLSPDFLKKKRKKKKQL